MLKDRLSHLGAPGFLTALVVLALNDHVLKWAFPGWFTGKLSDVAGLYAFAWFICGFVPRCKAMVLVLVAAVFVWWKSPLSGAFIHYWNTGTDFLLQRVVDPTDLLALPVLLLVDPHRFRDRFAQARCMRVPLGIACLLVFGATSRGHRYAYAAADELELHFKGGSHRLDMGEAELWRRVVASGVVAQLDTSGASTNRGRVLTIRSVDLCGERVGLLRMKLANRGHGLRVELVGMKLSRKEQGERSYDPFSYEREHAYYAGLFKECLVERIAKAEPR
jgi:hypothetical protein